MHSGEHQFNNRSIFSNFFHRQREEVHKPTDTSIWDSVIEENGEENNEHDREGSVGDAHLDQDQKVSANLLNGSSSSEGGGGQLPVGSLPLPIRPSVTQAPEVSSSPAALFLSAFMTPKPEPAPAPDDEGQEVAGYTLGSIIGFGGFSVIRKAFSSAGGVVAVKIIRRVDLVRTGHAPEERKRLRHEAAVWSSLSHEHILPLFSAVHTSHADFFITLYCPAGSLYDILKRDGDPALPQDDAGMMFRQVVRGLRYLHEDAMFVHRDMKLENVLVDESGVCRIGDFGMSVKIGEIDEDDSNWDRDQDHEHPQPVHRAMSLSMPAHKRAKAHGSVARNNSARHRNTTSSYTPHALQPGSLPYAAPELLLPHTSEAMLPHPSQDIWALGVMLYALLTGHLPFNDPFEPRLQMKILNGSFDLPNDIGRGAERILKGCLERTVSKRWTIAMVDDVAWGVGWGSAGDGATPDESQEDLLATENDKDEKGPYSHLTEDAIPEFEDEDWRQEERVSRSVLQAASRRSSSRAQRSLSRAPIPSRASRNPSMSRHSRQSSPPHTGRSSSFYYAEGGSASHSPATPPLRSRSPSRPRGRRPVHDSYFPSRSPSPSVVPTTPVDFAPHMLSRLSLHDPQEVLELEPAPRGRTKFISGFQTNRPDNTFSNDNHKGSPSATDPSQSPRWSSTITESSDSRSQDDVEPISRQTSLESEEVVPNYETVPVKRSRPGSTPPIPGRTWPKQMLQGYGSRMPAQDKFLTPFPPPNTPNTVTLMSRSRSSDYDLCGGMPVDVPAIPSP